MLITTKTQRTRNCTEFTKLHRAFSMFLCVIRASVVFCSRVFLLFFILPHNINAETRPNELGKILIMTYHKIGDIDTHFTRNRKGFMDDLELFKTEGFATILVSDFENKIIRVPAGKKPVILTFDDSSISQFEMDESGNILPGCAVGMMESFKKKNPDFPLHAIFFVTPGSKSPNDLFGQPKFTKRKVDFLLSNGYEIGNHTLWHANLNQFKNKIEEQLAGCQREVNKFLPDFRIYAMATPYGSFPPEKYNDLLISGTYKGVSYKNAIIFDYSNRLSFSPFDIGFNVYRTRRIHGFGENIRKKIQDFKKNPESPFVSDGDEKTITIPEKERSNLNPSLRSKFKIKIY